MAQQDDINTSLVEVITKISSVLTGYEARIKILEAARSLSVQDNKDKIINELEDRVLNLETELAQLRNDVTIEDA